MPRTAFTPIVDDMTQPHMIAIVGTLPKDLLTSNPRIATSLGVFTKRSEQLNGAPSYVKADNECVMLWWTNQGEGGFMANPNPKWIIGEAGDRGSTSGWTALPSNSKRIEDAKGTWQSSEGRGMGWENAPDVQLMCVVPPSSADEEVAVVGELTREQRDAEGRKRAIDLDAESPRKRSKVELETRVAKARSLCQDAVDARVQEVLKPAFEEYAKDKLDGAELDKRKAAARQQAAAGHAPLTKLDREFADYIAAVEARAQAEMAEDAAGAKLEAALAEHERGQAGPSSVKAEPSNYVQLPPAHPATAGGGYGAPVVGGGMAAGRAWGDGGGFSVAVGGGGGFGGCGGGGSGGGGGFRGGQWPASLPGTGATTLR